MASLYSGRNRETYENAFILTIFSVVFLFFCFFNLIRICMLLLFNFTLRLMNWDFNFISVFCLS